MAEKNRTEEIIRVATLINWFNDRKHKKNSLFDSFQPQYFWRLSDLSLKYPQSFNVQTLFSSTEAYNLKNYALEMVPNFKQLEYSPVHIETVRETYNIYDSKTQRMTTKQNGKNQNLSIIACEYQFNKIPRHEIEQAYFLFPGNSAETILDKSEELRLVHARQQMSETMKRLSSLINKSEHNVPNAFAFIIGNFWCKLYNVENTERLHSQYNIKNNLSPLDYMPANTLIYINNILQQAMDDLWSKRYYSFDQIKECIENAALFTRSMFIYRYSTKPELHLLKDNTQSRISEIIKARKNLLKEYYPLSLEQR